MTLASYLKNHPKKVLIFDFDHTLVALELPWGEYQREINSIMANFSPDLVMTHPQDMSFEFNYMDIAIQRYGEPLRRLLNDYAAKFESEKLKKYRKNEALISLVKQLHNQYQLFMWTSNMAATVKPILAEIGIEQYFSDVITRDRVKLLKPYSDGFDIIHKTAQVEKTEYLMIGDSDDDDNAAKSAGIDFYQVDYFKV